MNEMLKARGKEDEYFTFLYEIDCEREDQDLRIKEAKSSISTPIERLKETIGP